jgi:uncharacterized membrane protein
MVLMAIDHVRVYAGVPAGGPSPGVFFTRWVTHFCAPAFVFLAGTGAFLYAKKTGDKNLLSRFLLTRGLLLVVLELTLIRFAWTFNFNYSDFVLAGVIWVLGWCMVLMAALSRLPTLAVGITGLVIIFFQQLFRFVPSLLPASLQKTLAPVWEFIYPSGAESVAGINVLYVIVPWIGVMAAGYAFGTLLLREPATRKRLCLIIGLPAITAYIIIGSIIALQQPPVSDTPPFLFRLLGQRKYPASPLYLLMTLGPLIALLPFAEKAKGWLARVLSTIGSVPMFYYLLHIVIIHISALLVTLLHEGQVHPEWYATAPYTFLPEANRWPLSLLYAVFITDVVILYIACRWYARYKFNHPEKKWLKYL